MDIVDINYIDTTELDGYIRESLKRWDQTRFYLASSVTIISKRVWKDELNTRAAYYCRVNDWATMIIYVEYDEVEMTGRIEIEHIGPSSEATKQDLKKIMTEVVGSFEPLLAPLPFGVKCPHCGAKYVYKTRTGIVDCQNCGKPFDLQFQDQPPTLEPTDEEREPISRHIALDRSKIAHCKWCGTVESSNWTHSRYGKIYCSRDCMYADILETNVIVGLCIFGFPIVLLLPFIGYSSFQFSNMIPVYSIFWIMALILVFFVYRGYTIRGSRPKNSRVPR
jgi:hypothetical protein